MKLETLDDIKNLITSDTETDKIEFKKTTGQLERGMGNAVRLSRSRRRHGAVRGDR